MTSVEGADIIGGGMEFPMFTLIGDYEGANEQALYAVTAHELGHMWIPMIVGANEKRHAWIDEGATTFLENQAKPDYWPGMPDPDAADRESYLDVARLSGEQPMMRHGDYYEPGPGYGTASYSKPATMLVTLRNLLGREVFTRAYQSFIADWAFKHPSPWDFFNTFEREAGVDLDWFWRTWYYETWVLDPAVGGVEEEAQQTVVTVEDRGWAFMPTHLAVEMENGETLEREVPVSHWLTGATTAEVRIPRSMGRVVSVTIDPREEFPDVNRNNNHWTRN
jgi:aminopeptidase N